MTEGGSQAVDSAKRQASNFGGEDVRLVLLISLVTVAVAVVAWLIYRKKWDFKTLFIGSTASAVALFCSLKLMRVEWLRSAQASALFGIIALTIVAAAALSYGAWTVWQLHKLATPPDEIQASLAIALGSGAAVAFGLLFLQLTIQIFGEQQNLRAQRESVRLLIATESDLSGFRAPRDPADNNVLDMSEYWFRGKKMTWASLNSVPLRGANFVFTDLSGAFLRDADLSASDGGQRTDLRAANLYWSDLTGATVGNASFIDADLRRAFLCGVDLREANLTRADLRGADLILDPTTGQPCDSPAQLPPRTAFPDACWPEDQEANGRCGVEARNVVCQRDGRISDPSAISPSERSCQSTRTAGEGSD
jgi:hypothetical protein